MLPACRRASGIPDLLRTAQRCSVPLLVDIPQLWLKRVADAPAFFQYKEKNSYRAETCEQVAAACLALVHMMHCP